MRSAEAETVTASALGSSYSFANPCTTVATIKSSACILYPPPCPSLSLALALLLSLCLSLSLCTSMCIQHTVCNYMHKSAYLYIYIYIYIYTHANLYVYRKHAGLNLALRPASLTQSTRLCWPSDCKSEILCTIMCATTLTMKLIRLRKTSCARMPSVYAVRSVAPDRRTNALQACTDADHHTILAVADRVGLGVPLATVKW